MMMLIMITAQQYNNNLLYQSTLPTQLPVSALCVVAYSLLLEIEVPCTFKYIWDKRWHSRRQSRTVEYKGKENYKIMHHQWLLKY